jgi:hypothetical protein
VPGSDVESLKVKRLLLGYVVALTVRGSELKLEANAAAGAKHMAEARAGEDRDVSDRLYRRRSVTPTVAISFLLITLFRHIPHLLTGGPVEQRIDELLSERKCLIKGDRSTSTRLLKARPPLLHLHGWQHKLVR